MDVFELLRSCHKRSPFLFFNGNTFAEIGRALANALFYDLPLMRRKELSSAVAHYITGVLPRESMIQMVESLCQSAEYQPGDRIQTLRGTVQGVIVRVLDDGRVVWKPNGAETELTGLPESLKRLKD